MSENNKVFKFALKGNKIRGLKIGDSIEFSINKQRKLCEALVKSLEDEHLVIFVDNISKCWDTKLSLRRGALFKFDESKIEAGAIESNLTKAELELKRKDFINQMNDVNIYLYNFDLRRKRIEAEYNKRIKALKLEKVQALEELYKERRTKSELQLTLKQQIDRIKQANRYYRQ